ncbi:MAG: Anaerobic nitric oxide reductase transcription regulator NorR [bacterium]|nr:Anaerobic nitric oxide reductase transcription regulator NorR [bacterium]
MVEFPKTSPLFSDPKRLILDLAQEHHLESLLDLIVTRLSAAPEVVLARIWLIRPGEGCETCPLAKECPDRSFCLHLVAGAGNSIVDPDDRCRRLNGDFRRFPIGVRKVGRIAATGQPLEVPDLSVESEWVARPDWVEAEGVRGFGGQPLIHRGEVMGVLGLFSRTRIGDACLDWMRMIADHAASAIANARAWEEIQSLREQLELENEYLQEEVQQTHAFGEMVGHSPALQSIAQQIDLVAPTDSTVLILGESGTGKELVAREIHRRSSRSNRPLIKVNCASIPRELYESEFFGHVKGSFTGAVRDRVGRFELANGGTLFLDEVGEIPLDLQSKLLRSLQEGEFERVGEERTRKVDIRLIAATNRNLREEVEAGRFRSDLYYRLNVFPIDIVPLRKRKEDIPLLARHFLEQSAKRLNLPEPRLTRNHLYKLQRYDWPGNIREFQNVIERAVIRSRRGGLSLDLPEDDDSDPKVSLTSLAEAEIVSEEEMRRRERDNYLAALRATNWKIYGADGAAILLGLKPTTLVSRMKKMGLRKAG